MLMPEVMIQAPVVLAALRRPLRKTRASLGWSLEGQGGWG